MKVLMAVRDTGMAERDSVDNGMYAKFAEEGYPGNPKVIYWYDKKTGELLGPVEAVILISAYDWKPYDPSKAFKDLKRVGESPTPKEAVP